jgi:hypothetical protein
MALLAGCMPPQTAREFRAYAPSAFTGSMQSMEVDRPYPEISTTFQAKAPECLNTVVGSTLRGGTWHGQVATTSVIASYKPTVVVGDTRTEIHLQKHWEKNVIAVGKEPEGGYYVLVVDATPLAGNRTKLDIYSVSSGIETVVKAIMGWATGQNVGCPDMTKG